MFYRERAMAYFDPERREVVLRIVYDGLATAGKTANLRALHAAATGRARGGLVVPAETRTGRTLYFDWLELLTGYIDDWPLRCQILTVPGQFAHAERRFRLLREVDAAVLVCESSPAGVRAARIARVFLTAALSSTGNAATPIIVQANKQDLPGALPAIDVRARLGLGDDIPVVAACATSQEGVLVTFLTALAAARERVRRLLQSAGPEALPRPTATAEELHRTMLADEDGTADPAMVHALEAALAAAAAE